jgi:hypothetical protein
MARLRAICRRHRKVTVGEDFNFLGLLAGVKEFLEISCDVAFRLDRWTFQLLRAERQSLRRARSLPLAEYGLVENGYERIPLFDLSRLSLHDH